MERRVWTAYTANEYGVIHGFWEDEVLGTWETAKKDCPTSGGEHHGLITSAWNRGLPVVLVNRYGHKLEKKTTSLQ